MTEDKYARAFDLMRQSDMEIHDKGKKKQLLMQCWDAIPEPKGEWGLADAVWASLGYIEMGEQNFAEAIEHFEKANLIDVDQRSFWSHMQLGKIYLDHLNDPNKAREHFQKAWDVSDRAFKSEDPKYFLFFKGKK